MSRLTGSISGAINRAETFFDSIKLGYKWRYNRFGPIHIIAYPGFGTSNEMHLKGRVLDDEEIVRGEEETTTWENIRLTIRRLETDEIPDARVRLHFQDQQLEDVTDDQGFFEFTVSPQQPFDDDGIWQVGRIELLAPPSRTQDEVWSDAEFLVPSPESEFAVISDIDDTIMRTGATSTLRMLRAVVLNSGSTRAPFEGVSALYRELQKGPDGKGKNPVFYVSSSPVNLYGHFAHFIEARDMPRGPIFLKDFGFTREQFFSSGHETHKKAHVNTLLDTYPDLPFVLIGDSGQEDPEIYRDLVRRHSDHIRAIYIRDVTPEVTDQRDREVRAIAEEVNDQGVPMILAEDSVAAAEHAAENGLIMPDGVDEVRRDRREEEKKSEPSILG